MLEPDRLKRRPHLAAACEIEPRQRQLARPFAVILHVEQIGPALLVEPLGPGGGREPLTWQRNDHLEGTRERQSYGLIAFAFPVRDLPVRPMHQRYLPCWPPGNVERAARRLGRH